MAFWNSFRSILFGGAIGAAARTAVEPQLEPARQQAWSNNPNKVLDLGLVAALRAQGLMSHDDALDWAKREGFGEDKLAAAVQLAMRAPPHADAQDLRRRQKITHDQLLHAFAKGQIEHQYWEALAELVDERLSPQVVALAIVRGLIDDEGILPVAPPTAPGRVPQFPRFNVDASEEARAAGIDFERLKVLVGISGRPMGPEAAALAVFKGIIDETDYRRAVGEGDVRNEWADAIFENTRYVPSVTTAAGLWLRGWKTEEEALAIAHLHGASRETLRNEYLNRGRPATPRQVHLGYARGATLPGAANEDEALQRSVQESDIRTEWSEIEKANRWSYPSPFVVRQLTQSGAFDGPTARQILIEMGWKPEYAQKAADTWAGGVAGAPASKWLDRARSSLFTRARTEFVSRQLTEAEATGALAAIGVPSAEASLVLDLWTVERETVRTELTQAQIVKAFKKGLYTETEALAELQERGLAAEDAAIRLASG